MSAPLLPLEVLLRAMRRKWDEGDWDAAAVLARAAAPYLHPRASAGRTSFDLRTMSDDELERLCRGDRSA